MCCVCRLEAIVRQHEHVRGDKAGFMVDSSSLRTYCVFANNETSYEETLLERELT